MAVATTTALAIGGMAVTAGSAFMSFSQSAKQNSIRRQAEAEAAKAMAEARKKLGVNYTDKMAIKKEPYELQTESMLSAGNQAIQAGVESERGAATTAGKVMMAQNEAQAGIRTEMGKELTDIENKQIAEESRLRDLGVQLDLGEVEGAQMAAKDAQDASVAAEQQGFAGITSLAQQGLAMAPLFEKTGSARAFDKLNSQGKLSQADFQSKVQGLQGQKGFGNLAGVGGMEQNQFESYMSGLPKSQLNQLYKLLYPKT